jgi:dipeptidyl aminopeptidase/acylaminoacyl peptidase
VSADNRPLLILHSDNDNSIPVQQALDMVSAMEEASAPHEFVHYPDRGHMPIDEEIVRQSRSFIEKFCSAP